jgi:hypothetical protein
MAYDETRDEVILFGGNDGGADAETWAYDYATPTWVNQAPAASPPGRWGHRMVWSPDDDRIVLIGGLSAANVCYNDWYRWTGVTWGNVATDPDYDATVTPAVWYDTLRHRLCVYSGSFVDVSGAQLLLHHLWELPYNTTTWERVLVPDIIGRWAFSAVFSPQSRTAMVTQGFLQNYRGDTWTNYINRTDHYTHDPDTYARAQTYLHIHHTAETQDEDFTLGQELIQRTVPAWAKWTCGRYDEGDYGDSATGAEYGTYDGCTYGSV